MAQHPISHWYAVYTKANKEQKLRQSILTYSEENGLHFDAYLPLTTEVKQWSDREKRRQIPLFKNYLFVKHDTQGFHQIKKLPGFGDYIRFGHFPSTIPDSQINMIATIVAHQQQLSCVAKRLVRGDKVRICSGPMANYQGILMADADGSKVAIEVKNFDQCLKVTVPVGNLTAY